MSNSTKAGEADTRWGLKLRGDVMDTRLTMWWSGSRGGASEGGAGLWRRLKDRSSTRPGGFPGPPVSGGGIIRVVPGDRTMCVSELNAHLESEFMLKMKMTYI